MSDKRSLATKKQNSVSMYLSSATAIIVTLWFQTKTQDPFNLTKFSVLVFLTPVSLYLVLNYSGLLGFVRRNKIIFLALGLFLSAFLYSSLISGNTYQGMVGLYQRNLGFLTYLCFAILFLNLSLSIKKSNVNKLFSIFIGTGAIETFYGLIQYSGSDPVKWKNPYSPILGTFGNPNFQSAFLGITSAAALGVALKCNWTLRGALSLQILGSLFLIQTSNSSQGFMSFGVAVAIILLNLIRLNYRKFLIPAVGFTLICIGIAVMGILNKGPANFLYQMSISARGDYWRAAISMLKAKPFTGVGIERFGDYFGNYRDLQQVRGRSFATFSDNAHNAVLHFAATGGIFLALAYVFLFSSVVILSIRKLKQCDKQEAHLISTMLGIYIAFFTISLISPENIGFTIWSWIFGGGLIGVCSSWEGNSAIRDKLLFSKNKFRIASAIVILSLMVPATVFIKNINSADRGIWNSYAIAYSGSGSLDDLLGKIQAATENAPSEQRYKLLASSMAIGLNQLELSRKYAEEVLKINSQSVDAFKLIAISYEKESNPQKAIGAREKMLMLDPFNLENLDKLARSEFEIGNTTKSKFYLAEMRKIQKENPLVISLADFLEN